MSLSTYYLEYGRHVSRLHRRRRANAPTSNTAVHDNHEKINSRVSFSLYGYGAPLDVPLGRRSSAIRPHFFSITLSPYVNCILAFVLKMIRPAENRAFTQRSHQMFSFRTTPGELKNAKISDHLGFVFEENSVLKRNHSSVFVTD